MDKPITPTIYQDATTCQSPYGYSVSHAYFNDPYRSPTEDVEFEMEEPITNTDHDN